MKNKKQLWQYRFQELDCMPFLCLWMLDLDKNLNKQFLVLGYMLFDRLQTQQIIIPKRKLINIKILVYNV